MKFIRALPLALLLSACEPVATGVWNIETEIDGEIQQSVWTITNQPSVSISGDLAIEAEEVDFAGSRLSWSSSSASFGSESVDDTRVNFNGTVDGNRLFGTLYTQAGNFNVEGRRR